MKKIFCLLLTFTLLLITPFVFAEENENSDMNTNEDGNRNVWNTDCSDLNCAYQHSGVEEYKLSEAEAEIFYGDKTTFQRNVAGSAYIIYSIPYITSFSAVAYHWGGEEFEPFSFEISKNGEIWESAEAKCTSETDEGKWTRAVYEMNEINGGYEFLKILWPENSTYWTPVLGEVNADFGEQSPTEISINTKNFMTIPRFETTEYKLDASVYDQLGKEMDSEVVWSIELPEDTPGIMYDVSNNTIVISEEAASGTEFTVSAMISGTQLTKTLTITLKNFVYGDFNDNLIIDEEDLSTALENYLKDKNSANWNVLRYLDINGDEVINVIDIAYIAKQIKPEEEK